MWEGLLSLAKKYQEIQSRAHTHAWRERDVSLVMFSQCLIIPNLHLAGMVAGSGNIPVAT